jgi:hypothetical protein
LLWEVGSKMALAATLGIWFTGLVTLAGVIVALRLQNRLLGRNKFPTLKVGYSPSSSSDNRFLPPSLGSELKDRERQELWIRIRVKNESPHTAKGIQARFTSSEIDGSRYRENRPSWWFKVSNLNATAIDIPPLFTQFFDVAFLIHDIWSKEVEAFVAITQPDMGSWREIKSRIEQATYTRLSFGSAYFLYFALIGTDIPTTYYKMRIALRNPDFGPNGELIESDIRNCVLVQKPTVIPAAEAFAEMQERAATQ